MALRDYLEQRERELLDMLGSLYNQIAPLEAELAEVRRAKGAVGMPSEARFPLVSGLSIGSGLAGVDIGLDTNVSVDATAALLSLSGSPHPPINLGGGMPHASAPSSPYVGLTMKQLVLKALSEHFNHGAATRQLLDFFRDAWGRHIERTNLSPQISRLYQDRQIGRIRSNQRWFLLPQSYEGDRLPYWRRSSGQIIWMSPGDAWPEDEPGLTAGDHADITDDLRD
jgi:hypothetical protein